MTPDTILMVDWSGGNDTGPTPRKDAIWIAICRGGAPTETLYQRNRQIAEETLATLLDEETKAGRTVLAGFDFGFAFATGFTKALTGADDPLTLWDWFEERMQDTPQSNNRFDLAGEINARFPGIGPFWFNGLSRDIESLPRKGTHRENHGLPEKRKAETLATSSFPSWQMGGAGAVGSQIFTGLPVLNRLRHRLEGKVAVWPFEPLDRPVAFVEIWPSLLSKAITPQVKSGDIKDEVQVRILAETIARLPSDRLTDILNVEPTEEGWIFGVGHEDELNALAAQTSPLKPPPLRDDCFAMPRGAHWTPVDDALAHLRRTMTPVTATATLPLQEAAGRYTATPIHARRAHPPAANSAVDGYGFSASVLRPDDNHLPLAKGRAAAGAPFDGTLPEGQALRILTGAVLPDGVDTVVLEEDTTTDGHAIAFRGPLKPRANTRPAGEDVEQNAQIFEAGHRLAPQDLALLSATGHGTATVHDRLRVGVLSTGDELRASGSDLAPGQIHDANRPMLLALLDQWGFDAVDLGCLPDDRIAIRDALDTGAATTDAILTSGGASAGDEDHISALLEQTGAMELWRIAVKPGRPLALALWDGTPVFGLPGNPVAAFVTTLIFARPALVRLAGGAWPEPQGIDLPAAFSKRKKEGRREYLRARIRDGRAEVYPSEGSGRIRGLTWADGLVELPDEARDFAPGDPVRFLPFGSFGL
ncbi:gephyrin-like molybdotransferase Glp [Aestuariibius insulae]|uniref:molybdopterin-binding protein n=1 Tax=Aestuariibius insulae TaxID=2058287 RepID=UPI00345E8CBD